MQRSKRLTTTALPPVGKLLVAGVTHRHRVSKQVQVDAHIRAKPLTSMTEKPCRLRSLTSDKRFQEDTEEDTLQLLEEAEALELVELTPVSI